MAAAVEEADSAVPAPLVDALIAAVHSVEAVLPAEGFRAPLPVRIVRPARGQAPGRPLAAAITVLLPRLLRQGLVGITTAGRAGADACPRLWLSYSLS